MKKLFFLLVVLISCSKDNDSLVPSVEEQLVKNQVPVELILTFGRELNALLSQDKIYKSYSPSNGESNLCSKETENKLIELSNKHHKILQKYEVDFNILAEKISETGISDFMATPCSDALEIAHDLAILNYSACLSKSKTAGSVAICTTVYVGTAFAAEWNYSNCMKQYNAQ